METLNEITTWLSQRSKAGKARISSSESTGRQVLFQGDDQQAKLAAAKKLAQDAGVALQRIDLSQLVSQYIGETEKNLQAILDKASNAQAVLFFDEADALFGKRSDVKDSHDKYANQEVSYLLQKIEAYPGLAIVSVNQKTNLDNPFLRRLRFVVAFA